MKSYKVRKELFIEGSELWYRYYSAKDYIADNGYFIIQKDGEEIPVYIPMLVLLFENKGIPVEVLKSGEHQYIKGRDGFLAAYQEAFQYGKNDFETMYSSLRSQDVKAFISQINKNYTSKESDGWNRYRYTEPIVFDNDFIQKCGIVAGFLYQSEYWMAIYNEHIRDLTKKKSQKGDCKVNGSHCTVTQLALYYYYLQEARCIDWLENHSKGKTGAYSAIAKDHGTTPDSFKNKFTTVCRGITHRKKTDIEMVINLLADCPKAKSLAEDDINRIT